MKSRLWLNLALLVFVILLITISVVKPGIDTEHKTPSLTTIKIDDIKHVYIQRKHGEDISLEKKNHRWWMLQPVSMPADNFKVNSLLNLVETSVFSQHDLSQLDPANFGLNTPRAIVTINHDIKINFGASEPLHKRRYLSIANNLYTTNDLFYYQLVSDISRFLDPALLPTKSKVKRLILPNLTLDLVDGSWHRQPINNQLSADADVELIDAWQNSAALNLALYNEYKKLKENVSIYLEGTSTPISFNYQQDNDAYYLTRLDNGLRYTLPDDIAIKLALHKETKNNSETTIEDEVK